MRIVHLQPRLLRAGLAYFQEELTVPVGRLERGEEWSRGEEVSVRVKGFGVVEAVGDELVREGFEEGSDSSELRGKSLTLY